MLYHAPTGSTDPNAPYVGKNVAAGQQGSKVPPAAIEYTQREIVAAITAAGMSPTDTDLQQLLRAIRGGKLEYYTDGAPFTGTAAPTPIAGAPAILPNPAHTSLFESLHVRVKMGSPCTGPTNLSVSGMSAAMKRLGGLALANGDWATGDVLDLVMSGGAWQICGLTKSDVLAIINSRFAAYTSSQLFSVFQNGGAYTIPSPRIKITMVGAGGGGNGNYGGGSGAMLVTALSGLTVGATLNVNIGAGGTGTLSTSANGSPGGATTITSGTQTISTLTAGGGAPGTTGGGGLGGTATGGLINAIGGGGGNLTGALGGFIYPYGSGGSNASNGNVVNGVTTSNNNGIQGLALIEAVG